MCFFTCSLSSIWWDVNVCFNWTLCLCERCHKTLYTAECLLLACVLRGHVTQFEYRAWSECCLGSLYCNNSSVMITVKKKQYIIHCFRVIKNRLCPLKSRVNNDVMKDFDDSDKDESRCGPVKKKRLPTCLSILCPVCGGPAPDHQHFGGK